MEAHAGGSADMENRRAARRNRTLKRATIIFNGGYSAFDCTVRNLSDTGAMLQVASLGIPTHFELRMDAATPHRPCTVRWRTESAIGVSFDEVAPKSD
jgi:PilZ domain